MTVKWQRKYEKVGMLYYVICYMLYNIICYVLCYIICYMEGNCVKKN